MNITDEILEKLGHLPEEKQSEVLDFVEFLELKQSAYEQEILNDLGKVGAAVQAAERGEGEPTGIKVSLSL